MTKLSNDQLEVLVQKRNEAGLNHTVEVMNSEELAAYRNNCLDAIEKHKNSLNNAKQGGVMQQIITETIEQLEGYIAYIDAKLSEETKQENAIENFIKEWETQAVKYYTQLLEIPYKERVQMVRKGDLTKTDLKMTTHTSVKLIQQNIENEAATRLSKLYKQINNKVGEIISLNLKTNDNKGFDGVIVGTNATVRIETVLAGGENIQCLHYRTLMKVIK